MADTELYEKALELIDRRKRFALASVIHAAGSTPQKAGANAIFERSGPVWGTLGGGCLEAESRHRALQALDDAHPLTFDLKLDEVRGWDDGLVCGGKARIFVAPQPEGNADAYRAMLQARAERQPGLLLTIVSHPEYPAGRAYWVPSSEIAAAPWVPEPSKLQECLDNGQSGRLFWKGEAGATPTEVYVEPVIPAPRLIIAGGGHVGKAVAHMGRLLDFEVTVIDDRPAFANAKAIPDADHTICGDIAETIGNLTIDADTYVLIVTRGHRHDGAVLAACVHASAAFIGMIGSRRKSMVVRTNLVEQGLATEAEVARVVCPVGLEIGAVSVHEIAVSIAAQLVAVRRKQALDGPAKTFVKYDRRYSAGSRGVPSDGTSKAPASV